MDIHVQLYDRNKHTPGHWSAVNIKVGAVDI